MSLGTGTVGPLLLTRRRVVTMCDVSMEDAAVGAAWFRYNGGIPETPGGSV